MFPEIPEELRPRFLFVIEPELFLQCELKLVHCAAEGFEAGVVHTHSYPHAVHQTPVTDVPDARRELGGIARELDELAVAIRGILKSLELHIACRVRRLPFRPRTRHLSHQPVQNVTTAEDRLVARDARCVRMASSEGETSHVCDCWINQKWYFVRRSG